MIKKTTRKSPAKRSTGPTKEVREIVLDRARHRCERCGELLGMNMFYSIHHRIPRGMGGTDRTELNEPSNLLALCGSGTSGCHGWVESHRSDSYGDGWLCYRNDDPRNIMVKVINPDSMSDRFQYVYLSDDGTYKPV
jgi:hypothetical protein